MTTANIAEIKNRFSHYLDLVAHGEPVQVCKRNIAVAQIVPITAKTTNKTTLGCGKDTATIKADLTEQAMDSTDWNMLGGRLLKVLLDTCALI